MIYTVRYTSYNNINFRRHMRQLATARIFYNTVSAKSKNPKTIISIRLINSGEIEIKFYSRNTLAPGREANALWLFSHILAEKYGFDIYLTPNRKLFRAA